MRMNGSVKLGTVISVVILLIGVIVGYVRTQESVKQNKQEIAEVKDVVEMQCVKRDTIEGLKELTETRFESQSIQIDDLKKAVQQNNTLLIDLIKEVRKNNQSDTG